MDSIREAFSKVKQDISFLKEEVGFIKEKINKTDEKIYEILRKMSIFNTEITEGSQTDLLFFQTDKTDIPADNTGFKGLKEDILHISTGNRGVPTDRQTNRQTDKQTEKYENSIEEAATILNSLDNLRKEIRLKFKRLTDQELLVFSTIYQFDEEKGFSDYKTLSEKLNLTESSIRDYVGRLIRKGIPIEKTKINNKSVNLKISENLKKIATLPTILKLRDL